MNRSEQITNLASALAVAQAKFSPVVKGKRAEISAGRGYSYADLATVCEAVIPTLSEAGIAIIQGSAPDKLDVLETLLVHGKSGEWIATYAPIFEGRNGGAQGYGSGVTYARRYALLAAVGVAPEDDDDGAKASGANAKPRTVAQAASDGLKDAWQDAIEDRLPENCTGRQRSEAYTQAICDELEKMKSVRGLDGVWEKRGALIEKVGRAHPDLHGNILHTYETWKRILTEPEAAE